MATVFRPGARIQVPSPAFGGGALEIDQSHPLANGMFDCILWDAGGRPFNLTTGQDLSFTGSPTDQMTVEGPAGYVTGGSAYTSPDHGNMAVGDFTARIRFIPVSIGGTYTTLVTKRSGASAGEFGIYLNSSLQIQYFEIGTGTQDGVLQGTFTLGQVHDLVITRMVNAPTTVILYQNGIALPITYLNGGTTASAGSALSFGHDNNTDGDNKYLAFNFWNRVLSGSEVALLNADPYGFLIPAEGELPSLFTSGTPAVTVLYSLINVM